MFRSSENRETCRLSLVRSKKLRCAVAVVMAGLGASSLAAAAGLPEGVTVVVGVQRLETEGDMLRVVEQIVVRNASDPPRTLTNEHPLEMQLPPEAQVVAGMVQAAGSPPVRRKPAPGEQKGRYYFPFTLPTGETRFAVVYRLPYSGEALIEPRILYPLAQFAVVLPKSMNFEAQTPGIFEARKVKTWADVRVTPAVKPGQRLAFRVSGTGTLAEAQDEQQRAQGGQMARPEGDPSAPASSSRPLYNDRWFFLGGFAIVLTAGVAGFLKHKRKQPRRLSA